MKDLTYQPFSQSGLGRLHVDGATVVVQYHFVLLFSSAVGGGFLLDANNDLRRTPEQSRFRLQVGADNRTLDVIIGRRNGKYIPVISLGLVEAKSRGDA